MPKLVQRSRYTPTKGVDLKSSDRNRTEDYLTGGYNCRYDENYNLAKRYGFQAIADGPATGPITNRVRGGIQSFTTTDYKGVTKTEVIGFGRFPYRLVKAYSTITNSTGGIIILSSYYIGTSFFKITTVAGAVLLNKDISSAFYYMDDLVADIDALAGITCSTPTAWVTPSTTHKASYSEVLDDEPLANGATRNIEWYYWEPIPCSTWGSSAVMNPSMVTHGSDLFTLEKHGLSNADKVRFVSNLGAAFTGIPAPLVEGTDYYVVSATTNTFKVEASVGGGAINLTNNGSGFWVLKLFGGQQIYHNFSDTNFVLQSTTSVLGRLYSSTAPVDYAQSGLYGNGSDNPLAGWGFDDSFYAPANPFTTNQKHICKYDGQTWTRIHVPKFKNFRLDSAGTASAAQQDARGKFTSAAPVGGRHYKFSSIAIDKTGNVTESDIYDDQAAIAGGGGLAVIRYPTENNCLAGFNDHFATVNGAQSTVSSITVDAGHTFVAGDVAYFWDNAQLKFISREVTSVAATTVTISTAPIQANDAGGEVDVLDEALMSPNTRLAIWRTSGVSTATADHYLVQEVPFVFGLNYGGLTDPTGIVFVDDVADANLGAIMVDDGVRSFWPPYGNILANYNNQLCIAGVSDNKSTVFFGDATDIEAFPLATNSFNIDTEVRAMGQSGPSLAVFSDTKTNIVTGDLASLNFRVEKLSENVGCNSHLSIAEVEEGVIFFQTHKGPHYLANGRMLKPVGESKDGTSIIEPYFTRFYDKVSDLGAQQPYPDFRHSVGVALGKFNQYVLHVPWPISTAPNLGSSSSISMCFNYRLAAWEPFWYSLSPYVEFSGGMCVFEDELFGLYTNSVSGLLFKQTTKKGTHNYCDAGYAIPANVMTHWDSLKNPDLYKKYLWITLSGGECESSSWTVNVKSYLNYDLTTAHSNFTMNFTAGGPPQEQKLKSGKANSMLFDFSNSTIYETFTIQGWMYEVAGALKEQSSSWGNQNR